MMDSIQSFNLLKALQKNTMMNIHCGRDLELFKSEMTNLCQISFYNTELCSSLHLNTGIGVGIFSDAHSFAVLRNDWNSTFLSGFSPILTSPGGLTPGGGVPGFQAMSFGWWLI